MYIKAALLWELLNEDVDESVIMHLVSYQVSRPHPSSIISVVYNRE